MVVGCRMSLATLLMATVTSMAAAASGWVTGTWTTGYWDCCKPSCAWQGKGKVSKPVDSCDNQTGEILSNANEESVCHGGRAATCTSNKPFMVNRNLSLGFAAVAVSGKHGLTGDVNCGQCYELKFTDEVHSDGKWSWGGSHSDLVGKRMVIQVTNIGYDVSGDHSFDLMIPGAGQGVFTSGCTKQFPGYSTGDFDCDNRHGGCSNISGCSRLPPVMQDACRWRYEWLQWLEKAGKTNNPYVDFRRVKCPQLLTQVSGSVPDDDGADFPDCSSGWCESPASGEDSNTAIIVLLVCVACICCAACAVWLWWRCLSKCERAVRADSTQVPVDAAGSEAQNASLSGTPVAAMSQAAGNADEAPGIAQVPCPAAQLAAQVAAEDMHHARAHVCERFAAQP